MPSCPQGGGPSGLSSAAIVIGSVTESSADSEDMENNGSANAEIVMDLKFVMVHSPNPVRPTWRKLWLAV